jgi:hypothetical protein
MENAGPVSLRAISTKSATTADAVGFGDVLGREGQEGFDACEGACEVDVLLAWDID